MSAIDVRPAPAAPDAAPAELEPRLHAFAVDRLVDLGVPLAVGWALGASGQGTGVVVAGVLGSFVVLLLALAGLLGARGTSPGLALTGLRLARGSDLAPVGFAPALKRQAVLLLAGAPTFGIGWATLAWTAVTDPEGLRRGWHDQLAGAVVLDPTPAAVVEVAPEVPQQIVNLTAMRLAPAAPEPVRGRPARPATPTAPAAQPTPAVPGAGPASATPPPATPPPASRRTSSQPPPGQPPSTQVAAAPDGSSGVSATPAVPSAPAGPSPTPAPEVPAAVRRPGRRRAGVPTSEAGASAAAQHPGAPSVVPSQAAPSPTAPGASGWSVRLDTGEELPVDGLTLLGRGPQARAGERISRLVPLSSADMSVSKTHAQLQVAADGTLVAMDRGSTNGSVVVRRGVPRHLSPGRPTTLLDGDVLRLGDRTLEVSRRG